MKRNVAKYYYLFVTIDLRIVCKLLTCIESIALKLHIEEYL